MPPKKSLGQHFLRDQAVLQEIVGQIQPTADDYFLELAAGDGALTGQLLRGGSRIKAIELDEGLARSLQRRWRNVRLELLCGDLMALDWQLTQADGLRLRLAGNLPYNLSSLCLARTMHEMYEKKCWSDAHFLVQLEMAQRLTAEPGDAHWGRLGVLAQCTAQAEQVLIVEPDAFWPAPRVRSALVRLRPQRQPALQSDLLPAVLYTARHLFSMRRKTLRVALKGMLDSGAMTAAGLASLQLDGSVRAEQVDMAALKQIAECLRLPS